MTRTLWLRAAVVFVSLGLACPAVAACSPSFSSQPCLPPHFSLSPATAKPGSGITVTAGDASCNPRYGDNAQIQVEVYDRYGTKIVELLGPMNDAGGFSVSVILPADAVPGEGMVAAYPYNLDWCDDTGRNNRVGAVGAHEVKLASCAMPSKPLQIGL